ncbi:MAG TPA: hypothetical protein VEP90_04175 [Methylomirabilota bacterium]|nr:hypothetical protein [Methylomirabilota bacterium]
MTPQELSQQPYGQPLEVATSKGTISVTRRQLEDGDIFIAKDAKGNEITSSGDADGLVRNLAMKGFNL